ncbi:MAG: right-handed parallel beta-helix repeat-containing protein [Planctomycetales bacterium]|nr:right-handed parallel beta-helix repeat-containing protein [Planctomycetales bacterium]
MTTSRLLTSGFLIAVAATSLHAANVWHVSPQGDDAHPGSLEKPFATVARAQEAASPGDTVFFHGGVYKMTGDQIAQKKGIFARVISLTKSGEPGRPITYRAYGDERPVFDFSAVKPSGLRVSAFYVRASWLRLIGLDITGVQVTVKGRTQSICLESQGSFNVFERLSLHDGQAIGVYHVRGANNLFLNCDAWNNWDRTSEDGAGRNVDGFGCHPTKGSTGNVFRGCRAWFNSDDGFDTIGAREVVTIENCWAAYNGYSPDFKPLADGNGFKVGGYGTEPADRVPRPAPRHVVRFCVAVKNKANGFYANHHPGGCDWINNTAYRNGTEFNMLGRTVDTGKDVDGYGHTLLNNLSFGSRNAARREPVAVDLNACRVEGNLFSPAGDLSKEDFVNLNQDELFTPRDSDGSLPAIDFLRPAEGSKLIDAGVATGLPYRGKRPDVGAFER